MKFFNKPLVILLIIIAISSLVYSWQLERRFNLLHETLAQQTIVIEKLEKQVDDLGSKTILDQIDKQQVKGVQTAIGSVSGTVHLSNLAEKNNTIVCAYSKFTQDEFCSDELKKTTSNTFKYTLEIPQGKYFIYATTPPNDKKTYYSNSQKCGDNGCENNQKIMIEVLRDETQVGINIFK